MQAESKKKMFSIFYRMTETKIPDNIRVIIFKTNKKNQCAIIKGQLGQYKFKLYSAIKLIGEYQDKSISLRERGTQSQRESISLPINNTPCNSVHPSSTLNAPLYGIKTILQYNVDTNKFLGYYKTHFIYEQTIKTQGTNAKTKNHKESESSSKSQEEGTRIWRKKLKDIPFLSYNSTNEIPEGGEISYKKDTWPKSLWKTHKKISDQSYQPGVNAISQNGTKQKLQQAQEKKELDKLFIGYLISSPYNGNSTRFLSMENPEGNLNLVNENIAQNLGKDEKDKKIITELKKIFTGVSQGYTMNLELKGIGYSSSIRHINATTSFEKKSQAQLSQNMSSKSRRKHDLFTSYGKFECFFSCEDNMSSNNTNLSVSQESFTVQVEDKTTNKRSHYTKLTQIQKKAWKNLTKNENLQETYKKPTKRQVLDLNIGLSHSVVYTIPENHVSINCTTSNIQSNVTNTLTIFGISNAIVNQIAANIYHFKKPEPYKGKGIRYDGEKLFMKPEKKKS